MSSTPTPRAGVAPAATARGPVAIISGPGSELSAASVVPGKMLARVVSGLAVLLGVAHVWILAALPHGVPLTLAIATMVLMCFKCAYGAWNKPQALLELLAMSALMAITHTFMALGSGGHQHGGPASTAAHSSLSAAMLAVAGAELALVMLCSIGVRRSRPASQMAPATCSTVPGS